MWEVLHRRVRSRNLILLRPETRPETEKMPSSRQIRTGLRALIREREDLDKAIRSLEKLQRLRQRQPCAEVVLSLLAKCAA